MITANNMLIEYIRSQQNIEVFCNKLEVSRQTIYNVLNGENVSSEVVGKLLNETGFDFEKAFKIKN